MRLECFVSNAWVTGSGEGRPLINPVTGSEIARADATGVDVAAAMNYARSIGGAALRAMSFAQRGALLNDIAGVLIANREGYEQTACQNSGNTKTDASVDIDGGIATLKYYARLAKGLGDATCFVEETRDQLARDPVFFAQHVMTGRAGVAVQINAFNFPSWGLWEKVAVATLAGVPSVAKPATATALLSYQMVKDVVDAGVVPAGVLTLICGSGEALLDSVTTMDSIAFTGSAATGEMISSHPVVRTSGARVTIEADSVNATLLGPDAVAGTPLFDLAVREVVRAFCTKAGQLCTNIRRVLVPREIHDDFAAAVKSKMEEFVIGDPADATTQVGPLINMAQRDEAEEKISQLLRECVELARADLPEGLNEKSSFVAPRLLSCSDPASASIVHGVEVFGPCVTLLAYKDLDQAMCLAAAAEGSLALSAFTNDATLQVGIAAQLGAWHGRILFVDDTVGRNHTGHSIVMPQCVHGGPGRAGGGEELGGLRGLRFHMQRTAIQGSPDMLDRLQAAGVVAQL